LKQKIKQLREENARLRKQQQLVPFFPLSRLVIGFGFSVQHRRIFSHFLGLCTVDWKTHAIKGKENKYAFFYVKKKNESFNYF